MPATKQAKPSLKKAEADFSSDGNVYVEACVNSAVPLRYVDSPPFDQRPPYCFVQEVKLFA